MITTTAATAVSTVSVLAWGALGALAVVALVFLLIAKELSGAEVEAGRGGPRLQSFSRYVVLPIVPLFLVFAVIVAVKVWEVL